HAGRKFIPPEVAAHLAEHLGDEPLTDRELAVLRLVMGGNCNRGIGGSLFISEKTVSTRQARVAEVGCRGPNAGGHNCPAPWPDSDLAFIQLKKCPLSRLAAVFFALTRRPSGESWRCVIFRSA